MKTSLSKYLLLLLAICCVLLIQCTKEKAKEGCVAANINITSTFSNPCTPEGTITISFPIGNNWQYRIGNSAFQASPVFANLLPGRYSITAKNENDCSYSTTADVITIASGTLFTQVKALLSSNCTSCHGNINPQAGLNWNSDCDIIKYWDRIKARAVDGNPSPMPQAGLLPQVERNKITAWINAGHRFTD